MSNRTFFWTFSISFQKNSQDYPHNVNFNFGIKLVAGATPVTKSTYRLASTEMRELSSQLNELLSKGFVRSSFSPWRTPVWFVKKKDGLFSMCIDHGELNKITIRNHYSLPRMDGLFNQPQGMNYLSKMDLRSEYH